MMHALTEAHWVKFKPAVAAAGIRGRAAADQEAPYDRSRHLAARQRCEVTSIASELGGWHYAYLRFRR
jgi:hypothetical protein